MIVRMMDNTCVICGQIIPEGRQVCPICGTTDADIFGKLMGKPASEEEFKVDDELEQAFHQGFEAGMKHACELKEDNNRLQRENAFLKNQLELRARVDDMDGEYE